MLVYCQVESQNTVEKELHKVKPPILVVQIFTVYACILQFDSDGSGSIDFPEFLSLIAKIQKDALDDREEIKEAITVFDKDQKGFLTKNQVENIMNNIGEQLSEAEVLQILDSIQYDSRGVIEVDKLVDIIFDV